MNVYNCDAMDYLDRCGSSKCIFADPPDNIGLPYEGYRDRVPRKHYEEWLELLILKAMAKCRILWLSYYHEHDLAIGRMLSYALLQRPWNWQKVIWRFTFGQYTDTALASGYRPILLLWRQDTRLDYDAIRTVSERMLLGDHRAAGPRVPDDVWEIPRVVGNSPERRAWHPTQHPEELMERVVRLSCPEPDDRIADIFAGSGTTGRVARRLNRPCELVELSEKYCHLMAAEIPGAQVLRL